MRTQDGYDARDSYEQEEDAMGENVHNRNDDIESNGRRFQGTPFEVVATMRSLVKSQEEQQVECCHIAEFDRLAEKDRFWTRYIKTRRQ